MKGFTPSLLALLMLGTATVQPMTRNWPPGSCTANIWRVPVTAPPAILPLAVHPLPAA